MSDQIIYELNGVKYLLVEIYMTDSNKAKVELITNKFECIYQGIKELKQGFLSGYAIVKYLVPETKLIDFNKQKI